MYVRLSSIALLFAGLLLVGCAHTPPAEIVEAQRSAALARWDRCIEQETTRLESLERLDVDTVIRQCDGHKRDVLALWPASATDGLDALLLQRTREHVGLRIARKGIDAIVRQAAIDGDL